MIKSKRKMGRLETTSSRSLLYSKTTKSLNENHLDINDLKSILEQLSSNPYKKLDNLDDKTKTNFERFKKIVKNKKNDERLYKLIMDTVEDYFEDVEIIEPGTISSYFRGCFVSKDNNICSPLCSDSFKPFGKIEECDDYVILRDRSNKYRILKYSNKKYAKIYNQNSSHYPSTHLTKSNISELRKYGIKYIDVYSLKEGKYEIVLKNHCIKNKRKKHKQKDEKSNFSSFIVLFLLLIFIIFIFLVIFMKNRK